MSFPSHETLPRTSDLSDAELVDATLGGDRRAFAVLMRRYNQRVFRVTRGILRNDAEAEDACQEAFVLAYQKLDQLATPAAFRGWVSRIAANTALLQLRRQRTLRGIIEREEELLMTIDTPGTRPDEAAFSGELRARIEAALGNLPPLYRSVLVLRDIEELTTEEAADVLSVPAGTVRVRLHRARGLMRDLLGADLDVRQAEAFAFDGHRCDRLVAAVFTRLEAVTPDWARRPDHSPRRAE